MEIKKIDNAVSLIIMAGVFILAFLVIRPIVIAILFGFLFAYILHPVYLKLKKLTKNPSLTAGIIVILLIGLIAVPLFYFTPTIIKQTFEIYRQLQELNIGKTLNNIFPTLIDTSMIYTINMNFLNIISQAVNSFMNQFSDILTFLPTLLLQLFIGFFTIFFAIRDIDKFNNFLKRVSPFDKKTEKKLGLEFRNITNSIVFGQVLIGVIQGLCMGLGLLLLGFDNFLTLTVISIILGIIPVIGPVVLWLPLSLFLIVQGNITSGIILALYGGLFVSTIDNFLRPYLLSRSSNLPIYVSLIGTLGGLLFMGIIGLIIGPLILAYALIILEIYSQKKQSYINKKENNVL